MLTNESLELYARYKDIMNYIGLPNNRLALISGSKAINALLMWERENPPKKNSSPAANKKAKVDK